MLVCSSVLGTFGLARADRDPEARVRLVAPAVTASGAHATVGVELSPDLRAALRRSGGGRITVDWQSSRGRGCLTRRADPAGFDAAFDLTGLAPGTIRMTATVTTATETFTSAAATTTLFSLTSPYSGVNIPSGMPFSIKLIATPDTATIQSLTYQITSATGLLGSGSFAPSVFQPDGLGHLTATVPLAAPAGYAGSATLVFTATAQVVDANGVPQTATASVSLAMTIQPAPPQITVSFTTPAGSAFDAGTTANFDFTVMAADTFGMTAFYTVRDATGVPVATGTAPLTVVNATLITGRATWSIPGSAAGQHTITVTVTQGTASGSATLPFTVNPAPVVTLSILEPGPITATAGQPATVNFVIRGLTTLLGAGLTATLTDRATGATLSTATIAPETLAAQPDGSLAGAFTFTYPASAVTQTLDTNLTIALAVNNVPVTSGGVEVVIGPAPVPAAVFVVSAPAAARAGTSAPLTVGVSGVAAGDVASLFWSVLDAAGNTAATGNIPTSGLTAVGDHLEAATEMALGAGVPPGGYTLQVTMVTTGSQTFTATQPIGVLEAITLRFTVADGQMVAGEVETVEAVLRPRVTTGAASWFMTDPAGGTLPGFPAGTIAPFDFVAGTDPDGTLVWILHFVLTVPPAAVPQPISTLLQAMVFSETGAPLVTATTPYTVVPAPQVGAPTVDGLNPDAALPDTVVEVGGSGFVPGGTQVLVKDAAGQQTSVTPTEVSGTGGTLSFVVPLMTPAGTYQVAVRTAAGTSNAVSLRVMQVVEPALVPLAELIPLLSSPDRQVANKTRAVFAHLFGASPAAANGYVALLARGNTVAAAAQLEGAIRILVGLASVEPAAWQVAVLLKTGFEALIKQMLATARAAGVPDWLLALAQQLYQQALQLQAQGNLVGAMQNLLQVVDLLGGFLHLPAPLPIPTAVVVGPTCILLPPGFGHHSGTALFVLVHGWPGSVTWQASDVRGTEMGDPGATIAHVYGDVMELHVARPGQIQVTAVFQPVGEQPYIVTSLGSDVCHFELSQCPAEYLPSAKRGEDEIAFTAKILPDWHKSFIRFLLPQCSNEPGQCCNWPPVGDPAYDEDYDLEFRKQMPFDPPVHQAPPTLPAWTIRTSSMMDHATVLVHVRDYGAFGRIEARADICGVTNVAAHVEKPIVEQFATIPLDDLLRNGIADVGWEARIGVYGVYTTIADVDVLSHDTEDSPRGADVSGDLLSRYSEYRGFMSHGVHIRTSPDMKDVFVVDPRFVGPGYFTESRLHAGVHLVEEGEADSSGSIAFNTKTARIATSVAGVLRTERGIRIVVDPFLHLLGIWGVTLPLKSGSDWLKPPLVPVQVQAVHIDAYWIGEYGARLRLPISAVSTTCEITLKDPDTNYRKTGGRIMIDNELIGYSLALPNGPGEQILLGLVRGLGAGPAVGHAAGVGIPFFADPYSALDMVYAHECGHSVGMAHRLHEEPTIMADGLAPGEYLHRFYWDRYDDKSLGEFSVVPTH